jgi:DNA-binding NarL/FixJ family response regulator
VPGISIYVVSPYLLFCDLVQHRLTATESGLSWAGAQSTLDGLEDVLGCVHPDVVLVDMVLRNSAIPDVIGACLDRYADTKFVLLCENDVADIAVDCLAAGATASISKTCRFDEFLETLRSVERGTVIVHAELLTELVNKLHQLRHSEYDVEKREVSDREAEVLKLVAHGATNNEIAAFLGVSTQTVKNRLTGLFRKLGVDNRRKAAAWWVNHYRES